MNDTERKGIRYTPEDLEWAFETFQGRLTSDRSLPRLDTRVIDRATGEILGNCNDLEQLGKARTILDNARSGKKARCGVFAVPANPALGLPNMLNITTPTPDGQTSQHVVMMWPDEDWQTLGVIPRPGGPGGKPRVELAMCQYDRWREAAEPKWKDALNMRGPLNAAAMNILRASKGWQPVLYKQYAEKHLLVAWERKGTQKYNVPCDPKTGSPFPWVYERIAKGRRIELTSWDTPFNADFMDAIPNVEVVTA